MKRVGVGLLVLVGVGAASAWYWPRPRGPETLRLPGTVEVQEVRLGSKVGGRVAGVHVRESQTVEAGEVLVTFEQPELAARREQAKHRADAARMALEKATRGPRDEEIAEAKALADGAKARLTLAEEGFREEEKRQAKHHLEAARADLWKAEEEVKRLGKNAVASGLSTKEHDAAVAARDSARGKVKAAEAVADMTTNGTRPQAKAEAKADLARWTARYDLLRIGTRGEDKAIAYAEARLADAQLAEAEANLREATVTAAERCVVEVLPVRPGDLVPAGQPVVRALRADDLWVKVFAPSTELGRLRKGQGVEVAVDSHPGRRFKGEVVHIAGVSEFTPRNVQSLDERRHQVFAVKVRVTDPEGVFKSGMAAEVFVPVEGQ